ncbi:MAG: hypothetical protein ACI4QZ_01965 [Eubacteriales bacterium]
MKETKQDGGIPVGLSMAMAQDVEAMKAFGTMSAEEQNKVIAAARNAHSKAQMQSIVNGLAGK